MNNVKEVVSFREDIPPSTATSFDSTIKKDGTIEEIRIRIYAGPQRTLRILPKVIYTDQSQKHMIRFAPGTEQFVTGDDDYFIYPCSIEVNSEDLIRIEVENVDLNNAYTLSVDIIVDYLGGKARVL